MDDEVLNTKVCIYGIDPGTKCLGNGIITVDPLTFEIVEMEAFTINAEKLPLSDWNIGLYGDRFARIMAICDHLSMYLKQYNPVSITCESPYFNHLHPSAYGPLVEVITSVRRTIYDWNKWIAMQSVDPTTVKKTVKAKGTKKPDMTEALLQIPEFKLIDVEALDEHSIDGLAIAYYQYLKLRAQRYGP